MSTFRHEDCNQYFTFICCQEMEIVRIKMKDNIKMGEKFPTQISKPKTYVNYDVVI